MDKLFYQKVVELKQQQGHVLFDPARARHFIHRLFETLFICKNEVDNNGPEVQVQLQKLEARLADLLQPLLKEEAYGKYESEIFFSSLPYLYDKLIQDANALYEADPAAKRLEEVLLAYPGFFALAVYRFSNQLYKQGIQLLPRVLSEYAHSKTGIDIHPGATIGDAFVIDHGTGVVIGETTIIGNNVKTFQGVTLGALSVAKENRSVKRHPTIQDGVVIYSGATILGGDTTVGRNSIIGGNVWLTSSVPPFSIVHQQAEVTVQDKRSFVEPHNFSI